MDGNLISTNSISFEKKIEIYAESLTSDVRMKKSVIEGANIAREKLLNAAKEQITVSDLGLLSEAILFERHRPHDETFKVRIIFFGISLFSCE